MQNVYSEIEEYNMKKAMVLVGVIVISVNILGTRVFCFEQKKMLKIGQARRNADISNLERKKKGLVLWNAWAKDQLRKNTKKAELIGYYIKKNNEKIAELDQQIQQIKNSQNN